MPNWCENLFSITAKDNKSLQAVKKIILNEDNEVDFALLVPEPSTKSTCPMAYRINSADDAQAKHLGYDITNPRRWFNWYEWRLHFWGCKWNASDTCIEDETDDSIVIYYSTPWSPAGFYVQRVLLAIKDLVTDAKCFYFEPGMGFAGAFDLDIDCASVSDNPITVPDIPDEPDDDFVYPDVYSIKESY